MHTPLSTKVSRYSRCPCLVLVSSIAVLSPGWLGIRSWSSIGKSTWVNAASHSKGDKVCKSWNNRALCKLVKALVLIWLLLSQHNLAIPWSKGHQASPHNLDIKNGYFSTDKWEFHAKFALFCNLDGGGGIVRWEDLKWNCKPFQQDRPRVKEHDSGVPNMFFLKSLIKGHRIHQLSSLADSAWVGHIGKAA